MDDEYIAIMLDGMTFGKFTIVAAMGITADGRKKILGIIEGGSENAEVVIHLTSRKIVTRNSYIPVMTMVSEKYIKFP